jgi:DNA polymerase-3 subunit beta|tara:strand:- start:4039 stop:5154 length:1116 start_codon:yes stop_codon:yes gene_type:complete
MKFSTTKTDLQASLQKLSKIVPARSTIPILGNVLITSDNGSIIMRATDLEQTMILNIPASIKEEGNAVVPVNTLLNVANELPDGRVTLSVDSKLNVSLKSESGDYDLKGMASEEFPAPPETDEQKPVTISSELLKIIFQLTGFAISRDELKPALTGVLFQFDKNMLTTVATDGHRLVRYKIKEFDSGGFSGDIIIPRKFLSLSQNLLGQTETVEIQMGKNHITASFGDDTVHSRIIDERYPDFESVIPTNNDKMLTIDLQELTSAVRRVSIFSNRTTQQIAIKMNDGTVEIATEDPEKATRALEKLSAEYTGEPMTIGYNASYLKELLSFMPSKRVVLKLNTPISATVFYPEETEEERDITMLLMPIRLND